MRSLGWQSLSRLIFDSWKLLNVYYALLFVFYRRTVRQGTHRSQPVHNLYQELVFCIDLLVDHSHVRYTPVMVHFSLLEGAVFIVFLKYSHWDSKAVLSTVFVVISLTKCMSSNYFCTAISTVVWKAELWIAFVTDRLSTVHITIIALVSG